MSGHARFNEIKQCRRIATRYDKLAANYLAFVKLAAIRIWLRAPAALNGGRPSGCRKAAVNDSLILFAKMTALTAAVSRALVADVVIFPVLSLSVARCVT